MNGLLQNFNLGMMTYFTIKRNLQLKGYDDEEST